MIIENQYIFTQCPFLKKIHEALPLAFDPGFPMGSILFESKTASQNYLCWTLEVLLYINSYACFPFGNNSNNAVHLIHASGHRATLWPLPQGGHRIPGERPSLSGEVTKYQHGGKKIQKKKSLLTHTLVLLNCCPNSQPDKLAKELDFVHNNLRTKLDELKREEMNRLRMLIKAKHDMELGDGNPTLCCCRDLQACLPIIAQDVL